MLSERLKETTAKIIPESEISREKPHIGEGGFGKVYKGIYDGKAVAIKKLILQSEDKSIVDEIINEIKVILMIEHEDIPIFYGLWVRKNRFHLIFEFIDGPMLKDVYKDKTARQKLEYMLRVLSVLDDMHSKKIIHRDIKPSNVMLTSKGCIKVIDFGVSKIAKKTVTATKNPLGTVNYIPPENYDADEDQDNEKPIHITPKFDIWSVGTMISEIFSGYLPWRNKVNNEIQIKKRLIMKSEFPIPSTVPALIVPLIEMSTKIEVAERATGKELVEAIQKILDGTEIDTIN